MYTHSLNYLNLSLIVQETVNRREKQLQSTKMRLRLKDEQLLRLKNSTKTMGKSDSKLDLAESCEEDYEKQKLREEIQILKASLENQSPEVVQVKKSVFLVFYIRYSMRLKLSNSKINSIYYPNTNLSSTIRKLRKRS